MAAQHTPGPWWVDTPHLNDITSAAGDVCVVPNKACEGASITFATSMAADREEAWANARLIAAAPDLLASLTALADAAEKARRTDGGWDFAVTLPAARAAIARATQTPEAK
jgi:hypothetical protein